MFAYSTGAAVVPPSLGDEIRPPRTRPSEVIVKKITTEPNYRTMPLQPAVIESTSTAVSSPHAPPAKDANTTRSGAPQQQEQGKHHGATDEGAQIPAAHPNHQRASRVGTTSRG